MTISESIRRDVIDYLTNGYLVTGEPDGDYDVDAIVADLTERANHMSFDTRFGIDNFDPDDFIDTLERYARNV